MVCFNSLATNLTVLAEGIINILTFKRKEMKKKSVHEPKTLLDVRKNDNHLIMPFIISFCFLAIA